MTIEMEFKKKYEKKSDFNFLWDSNPRISFFKG